MRLFMYVCALSQEINPIICIDMPTKRRQIKGRERLRAKTKVEKSLSD